MKSIFYTFLSLLFAFSASAQLINDGASIIVEDGATLFIEGSLQNNLTGSINILGTGIVEVEGDITIAPTSTVMMSNTAKVILSGANASNVTSGGATFTNVEMDKTSNNVTLLDEMRISTDLNFVGDDNKLILEDNNLVFAPGASITSADDNEYIVADGDANTGVVSKEVSADEVFKFEVGDATNYTPLDADITGTGFSSATVDVNVVAMKQPNAPAEATDFISRFWNVDQTGITDFSADLEGTYVAGDLTGTAADTKGAHYGAATMDWFYDGAATGTNSVLGTVAESGDFTGTNSFGKVSLKAFLAGNYSGGSMTTTLNDLDLLPLVSPYGDGATVAAGFFDNNPDIVDWVYLEIRNATTPSTLDGGASAFIKSDGSIVSLNGTSNPLILNAGTTGFVVLKHRNHLSVQTDIAIDLINPTMKDLTSLSNVYTDGAVSNTPLKSMGGGNYAMWSGDVNQNGSISYNGGGNDKSPILIKVGFLTPNNSVSGYEDTDVNMNGNVSYNGGGNDKSPILINVGFLTPNNAIQIHKNY